MCINYGKVKEKNAADRYGHAVRAGAWIGGVGAVPGAVIGGVMGGFGLGIGGSYLGGHLGEKAVDHYHNRKLATDEYLD